MTVALGCHVNGTSRKRVEIKRTDYRKTKTTSKWKFVSILVFSTYINWESENSEGSTIEQLHDEVILLQLPGSLILLFSYAN